ncbi:MAG: hypothetical protein K0M78_07720, partial [Brevundimonas sp.]|nr:hypothetical protein [Brevundimonas sp.]
GKGAERSQEQRGGKPERSDGEARGRGQDRSGPEVRPAAPEAREMGRGPAVRSQGQARNGDVSDRPGPRSGNGVIDLDRDDRPVAVFRAQRDRGLIAGCPPGLARRDNGCLPPGQERKIARARYADLWGRDRDGAWRYEDGYLYQLDPGGSVKGWLPVLGGALSRGTVWPSQYAYQPVPQYYADYFRLNAPTDYRYANGALYGVDPQTQAITQVVALLTGQPITVGQQMPAGYDVYNVPYAWRERYADTAAARYRYSDGYVYRVDPTTQLVQAAIQLVT